MNLDNEYEDTDNQHNYNSKQSFSWEIDFDLLKMYNFEEKTND
jgi:hypothetical protein